MTFIIGQKNTSSAKTGSASSSKKAWNRSSTMNGFRADVLDVSQKKPVVTYFSSPRVPQGTEFSGILEKVLEGFQGKIDLVQMQAEECMGLLSQLGVQGLPAVYIFHQGQVVDGFSGILPEKEMKIFFEALFGIPDVNLETLLLQARNERYAHNFEQSCILYEQVLAKDAENLEALSGIAHCYISLNTPHKAEHILASFSEAKRQKTEIKSVSEHLNLWTTAQESFSLQRNGTVFEQIEEQEGIYHQALVDFFENREEKAMKQLLSLIMKKKDWSEGKVHRTLVCMFDVLGFQHPLVQSSRGRLASILFS